MERELTQNNKALDEAASNMSDAEREAMGLGKAVDGAGRELSAAEKETGAFGKALDGTGRELTDAEKEAMALGKTLDDTGKELDSAGKETKNLGDEMDETGKKTSIFGDVLKANLAADAIKAGLSAVVDMVKSVGAAVKDYVSDGSAMATVAAENQAKLVQVMRNTMDASDAQIASVVELTKAQEKLGVVSSSTQLAGAQELGTYLEKKDSLENLIPVLNDMVAQQYGVNASQESAVNIATMLGKVMNGQVGALSRYGYSFTEAQAEILKFGDESERAAILADVVGESVGGMNYALAQTDAGKMSNLNTVLDNTKIAVGSVANEVKAQIMGQLLPSISMLSDSFIGVLRGEGSVEDMAAAFDGVFTDIVDTVDTFLPKILDLGGNIITAVVTGISNNTDTIIKGALGIIDMLSRSITSLLPIIVGAGTGLLFGLLDGVVLALPSITEAAVQIIITLVQGLGFALPELIPAIVGAVVFIAQILLENMPLILDVALLLINGLAAGLLAAIPLLVRELPAIIDAIVKFVILAIPQIVSAGIQLLVSLVKALPDIISAIVKVIPQIISSIIAAVLSGIPLLIDAGVQLLIALVDNLPFIIETITGVLPFIITSILLTLVGLTPQIIEAGVNLLISLVQNLDVIILHILTAIPLIIVAIVKAIIERVGDISKAGEELIKGLWSGILNVKDWIIGKIRGFMSDITNSIRSFFGINSESKLYAEIGRNLGLGIGMGFEDVMEQVGRDMRNAIPTDFNLDVDGRGGYPGGRGGGAGNITQHISITSPKALSEKEAAREFRNLSRKLALGVT